MKIAITGATGKIGQYVVKAALDKGHQVLAITRSKHHKLPQDNSALTTAYMNLAQPSGLVELLQDCDAVIHLAATLSGKDQHSLTLKVTRQVLAAMDQAKKKRLILISSIAVLDYLTPQALSIIDESTPLCKNDAAMGDYARMKRDQEKICQEWNKNHNNELLIIRPGLVYDDDHLPDAHAGLIKKGMGMIAIHNGKIPLVSAKYTAKKIISVASNTSLSNQIYHLIGGHPIKQTDYLRQLKAENHYRFLLPLPWQLYSSLTALIRGALLLLKKEHDIPDSLRANSVAARQKPFVFSNEKANF